MRYKYTVHLNDLKDLKHIEWFVLHSDNYEFKSPKTQEIIERLKRNIHKKNIFYSEIVKDYEELVAHFDNNPYNYEFNILGDDEQKDIKSSHYSNYFVKAEDKDGNSYTVPYRYIVENPIEHNLKKVDEAFNKEMEKHKDEAVGNFEAVHIHYLKYWREGGVKAALERYNTVGYGKGYHLPRTVILYLIYNIVLMIILHETQFLKMVTHFWQILSTKAEAVYSAVNVYSGHRYLGTIAVCFIVYFVIMDIVYTYGIYYIIYVNKKYNMVKTYHEKVAALFAAFCKDRDLCKRGIVNEAIPKSENRDKVYIPLIEKTNRRYNFMEERRVKVDKDKTEKKLVVQSVTVPLKRFYTRPLRKRVIGILILLIYVQAICNSYQIMYH